MLLLNLMFGVRGFTRNTIGPLGQNYKKTTNVNNTIVFNVIQYFRSFGSSNGCCGGGCGSKDQLEKVRRFEAGQSNDHSIDGNSNSATNGR